MVVLIVTAQKKSPHDQGSRSYDLFVSVGGTHCSTGAPIMGSEPRSIRRVLGLESHGDTVDHVQR